MAKNNGIKMVDFGATIPEQVNIMVDIATALGSGRWPDLTGNLPKNPNKKDVIGFLLYQGAKKVLNEIGLEDVARRTTEKFAGEYKENLYSKEVDQAEETPSVETSAIMDGITSESSES